MHVCLYSYILLNFLCTFPHPFAFICFSNSLSPENVYFGKLYAIVLASVYVSSNRTGCRWQAVVHQVPSSTVAASSWVGSGTQNRVSHQRATSWVCVCCFVFAFVLCFSCCLGVIHVGFQTQNKWLGDYHYIKVDTGHQVLLASFSPYYGVPPGWYNP